MTDRLPAQVVQDVEDLVVELYQLRSERSAVIDAVNLYGDEVLHKALDDCELLMSAQGDGGVIVARPGRDDKDRPSMALRPLTDDYVPCPACKGRGQVDGVRCACCGGFRMVKQTREQAA